TLSTGNGRSPNWTLQQDRILLDLLIDVHHKTYGSQGTFKAHVFQDILHQFNTTANVIKDKDSLKYRWRNIKKVYHIYEQLRTRSGSGWDDEQNLPVPPDEESIHAAIAGHERRCYNVFRLHPTMFMRLRDELMERDLICDSRYVKATEKLTIFMYAMGHGVASGAMCEHFQHFSETISKHVCEVTKALASLRFNYIKLPTLNDPVHPRIRHDDIFYPYFKFNPLATGFKGRTLPLHNDLVKLFSGWVPLSMVTLKDDKIKVIPMRFSPSIGEHPRTCQHIRMRLILRLAIYNASTSCDVILNN
ncbi:hypothetical protein Taro_025399, partial [Colocasia esculenta]|nr:hypothetical protein [Colocasia esculenta]